MSWSTIIISTLSYCSTEVGTPCEPLNKIKRKMILVPSNFEWWKKFLIKFFRDFINSFNVRCLFSNHEVIINEWLCKNDQKLTWKIHKLIYCSTRILSERKQFMLNLTIFFSEWKSFEKNHCAVFRYDTKNS